jgi:ABC-type glycerol-3-phosphate transport system substrate-binding protein
LGHALTDNTPQKGLTALGYLPVRKSVGNIYPDDINMTTALATLDNPRSMGRFPGNGEIRTLWMDAARAAFAQQKTPEEAIDEMCRLAGPVMAKYVSS